MIVSESLSPSFTMWMILGDPGARLACTSAVEAGEGEGLFERDQTCWRRKRDPRHRNQRSASDRIERYGVTCGGMVAMT